MASFNCSCGKLIALNEIPSRSEWLILSDIDANELPDEIATDLFLAKMRPLLRCEFCNRIWIFWDGREFQPTEYVQKA